jgi:pilus assembly protein CpaB
MLTLSRRRIFAFRTLAALAALGTGLAVYSYLFWLRSQAGVSEELVPVVVATRDLPPGTVLEPPMVEVSRHPGRHLPPGAIGSVDSALGEVVAVPLFRGDPITGRKIGRDRGGGPSAIPNGMRAYTLLAASGWGPAFRPRTGQAVDVIVTLPQEVLGEARSVTVVRSRRVAAVGSVPSRPGLAAGRMERDPSAPALMITLFVTSEEAERLAMAESLGRVTVVLAPENAGEGDDPAGVTPRDLGAG